MSESGALLLPAQAFSQLPAQLRADLLGAFEEIVRNFAEGRWEPAELNGGKLCEAAYTVCKGIVDGSLPDRAAKPRNMVAACQALEQSAGGPRSIRIQIPRMLIALYEIRNNRNVGHVGGDVDPNHMDAVCVLQVAKWIVAELIRVIHQLPIDQASELVDALVERETPLVWKVGDQKRVLDPKMTMKDKALLLLHASVGAVDEATLVSWVEHSNPTVFRRDVLKRSHKARLLEYDAAARTVTISPSGVAYVEQKLLPRRA
ncbi:MAG: hypothetical protein ACYC0H_23830 [Solirubrobacteraceae bacterium]